MFLKGICGGVCLYVYICWMHISYMYVCIFCLTFWNSILWLFHTVNVFLLLNKNCYYDYSLLWLCTYIIIHITIRCVAQTRCVVQTTYLVYVSLKLPHADCLVTFAVGNTLWQEKAHFIFIIQHYEKVSISPKFVPHEISGNKLCFNYLFTIQLPSFWIWPRKTVMS